jgi:hypothetical protein
MNLYYYNRSGVTSAMRRYSRGAEHCLVVCIAVVLLMSLFISPFAAAQQPNYASAELQRLLDRVWYDYIEQSGFSMQDLAEQQPEGFAITLGYVIRQEFPNITNSGQLINGYPALANDISLLLLDVSNVAVNSPPPDVLWGLMLSAVDGQYDQFFQSLQQAGPGQQGYGTEPPPDSPKLTREDDNNSITLFGESAQGVTGLPSNAPPGELSPDMLAGTWVEKNNQDQMVIQPQGNNTYVGKIVAIGKPSGLEYPDRSVLLDQTYVFTFSGFGRSNVTNGKAAVFAVKQQNPHPQYRNEWRNKTGAIYYTGNNGELLELGIGCAMTGERWQRRVR